MFITDANLKEINAGVLDEALDAYLDGVLEDEEIKVPDEFIFDTIAGCPLAIEKPPCVLDIIVSDLYRIRNKIEEVYTLILEEFSETLENYSNDDDSDIILESLYGDIRLCREFISRVPEIEQIQELEELLR